MNQSPFRFIRCESASSSAVAAELGKPPSASLSSTLTASAEFVAAAGSVAGDIVLVNKSSRVSNLSIHSKGISHVLFSHFNDCLLSVCAFDDQNVSFTSIEESNVLSTSKISLSSVPNFTSWHPSCSNVGAACASDVIHLLDVDQSSVVKSHDLGSAMAAAADFSADGSVLCIACATTSGRSGKVEIMDPRISRSSTNSIDVPLKPQCIKTLKNDSYFVVLGQGQAMNPSLAFFDKKSPKSPVFTETLQLSPGVCLSTYDRESSLLSVSTRGATSMLMYDLNFVDRLNHLATYWSKSAFQALASKPRRCLHVDSLEVGCIFQLTTSSIETISLVVPRKSKNFSRDLFPDTVSTQPCLSSDEYFQGKNSLPRLFCLNNNPDSAVQESPKRSPQQVARSATEGSALVDASTSKKHNQVQSRLRKNLVAHITGRETRSLDSFWFGVKPCDVSMPLGINILLNSKHIAVPWKTLGASSLGVISLEHCGRVEPDLPLLRAHGQQLTGFALSDIDPGLMVTGCYDAHVRVWRFGWDRFQSIQPDLVEPDTDVLTPGRVTFLSLNPVSSSVLAVASLSCNSAILGLYDITSTETSSQPRLCIDCHPEPITSVFFDEDGNLIATTCKDRMCRIIDARKSVRSPIAMFEMLEGVRDTYVVWVGRTGYVLTIGFGNASSRQISLWQVLDGDGRPLERGPQRLATCVIDQSSTTIVPKYDHDIRLLYVAGIGDRTLLFFAINLNKSGLDMIERLGKYTCSSIVSGIAFLPKTMCDVANVEVGRALYITDNQIRPISFTVPRKRKEYFQDDLFPDTPVVEGGMAASEWFDGRAFPISTRSLQPIGMERLSDAPPEAITDHQLKRLEFLEAEKQHQDEPTVEQHIEQQLLNVDSTAVATNRWDATPISDVAVADDEWD